MTPAAHQRALEGINGMARKVFDAVPIGEAWSKAQIVGEMRRLGSAGAADIVEACLHTLRGRGLFAEPERGQFRRVVPRPSPTPESTEKEPPMAKSIVPAAPKAEPLARFADAAKQLRSISTTLGEIADDIEEAGMAAEERVENASAGAAKLRQLQELLKGLGA